MPNRRSLLREPIAPPGRIAALARLLEQAGMPAEKALEGTGLEARALADAGCRTSIGQYLAAAGNVLRLSREPSIALRAGRALHLSDHGLYGLLLLSCGSMRDYFRLAAAYQGLSASPVLFDAMEDASDAYWVFWDELGGQVPAGLRIFLMEQQFAQQAAHVQEALGVPCRPAAAYFAHPAPAHRALYAQELDCPCFFDAARYELRYPREVLRARPSLSNPATAAMLQSSCDELLAQLHARQGFAGKVYATLEAMRDPGAGMKAVAAALKMTERTLRRRLAQEGTGFTEISHEVRYGIAARHLRGSDSRIEDIAAMSGFSDTANFRRAFIRWTRMSPAQFRRLQHAAATP